MVEVRRVELLSTIPSMKLSPSAVHFFIHLFNENEHPLKRYIFLKTLYSRRKSKFVSHKISAFMKLWVLHKNVAGLKQQLIRSFRYLRLYLVLLFYSGQSNHPLLAYCTSSIMSKPLHPHMFLLYTIFWFFSRTKTSKI